MLLTNKYAITLLIIQLNRHIAQTGTEKPTNLMQGL